MLWNFKWLVSFKILLVKWDIWNFIDFVCFFESKDDLINSFLDIKIIVFKLYYLKIINNRL